MAITPAPQMTVSFWSRLLLQIQLLPRAGSKLLTHVPLCLCLPSSSRMSSSPWHLYCVPFFLPVFTDMLHISFVLPLIVSLFGALFVCDCHFGQVPADQRGSQSGVFCQHSWKCALSSYLLWGFVSLLWLGSVRSMDTQIWKLACCIKLLGVC